MQKLKQESKTRFLHWKTQEILDKEDLEKLWTLLRQNVSPPNDQNQRINYNSYLTIASQMPQKCRHFFTATTFLKFDRDEYGRIDIVSFFHSIVRKVNLLQTRIQISLYDSEGKGYLTEKDMENYFFELIPIFAQLQNIQQDFIPYYIQIAVRKFIFLLDFQRKGFVYIKDILTSQILAELYEMRQENLSQEEKQINWFTVINCEDIYNSFVKADKDQDGFINKNEFKQIQSNITNIVVERIFDLFSDNGQLSFQNYLDFLIAIENKKSHMSIQYYFQIFDLNANNFIDKNAIQMFFSEIIDLLEQNGKQGYKIQDIYDEIIDMVNPKGNGFTFEEFLQCGQQEIIIMMLTDVKEFYNYDQRESGNQFEDDYKQQ